MTPAFIFAADWHVCRSAWAVARGIVGDSYFALRQVVDLAVELKVPLLAGGDLFDTTTPHVADIIAVRAQLDRLGPPDLRLYYVQGQHERVVGAETPWLSAIHGWPDHVDGRPFDAGPFTALGIDWRPAAALAGTLACLPKDIDFVLCHQAWGEVMSGKGTAQVDGRLADIPGRADVLTGDFHKHMTGWFGGGRRWYSPGALHRLAIDEPESAVYVFGDDGVAESVPIAGRLVRHLHAADADDFDKLVAHDFAILPDAAADHARTHKLPKALRAPLVRVHYPDDIPDAYDRLLKAAVAAGDGCHLFPAPFTADVEAADARAGVEAIRADGLVGGLDAVDLTRFAGVDPVALRRDLARVLTEPDVGHAVESIVAGLLADPPPRGAHRADRTRRAGQLRPASQP